MIRTNSRNVLTWRALETGCGIVRTGQAGLTKSVYGGKAELADAGVDFRKWTLNWHRRSQICHDPDCHQAIVYQFWLERGGGTGGWGRAKPIVPGGASKLALRVSTLLNVVRNAAITAITKAVAKMANTVRWVIGPPTPTPATNRSDGRPHGYLMEPQRGSKEATHFSGFFRVNRRLAHAPASRVKETAPAL